MKRMLARLVLGVGLFSLMFLFEATGLFESPVDPVSLPESSGALEALQWWSAARAYPALDIPSDKYYQAWRYKNSSMRKARSAVQSDSIWQYIGPNNFGGRMISVAVNPLNANTIYAGSAAGGLWVTNTGGLGEDWRRISTGFPVLGVNAIAIDPTDTNTIFIGTGELYRYQNSNGGIVIRTTRGSVGMGILKTTDAGLSWEMSLDWTYNQQRGVAAIRFNPLNPATLLAATSEGVYRSTDRGGSWNPVLDTLMARDIAIHPTDTTKVLATCGNFASPGAGIYRSTDGGQTFEQLPGFPDFSGMAVLGVFPAGPDTVFLSISDSTMTVGTLWESTDFGETWALNSTDNNSDVQGWYARFLAVHPLDATMMVRGAQSLYKSVNGGFNFFNVPGGWADYHAYAYNPTDPNSLYIADDGGIWLSTDFGSSFDFVGSGIQTAQFYSGFSSSANDSLRAIGQVQDHFGWMYVGTEEWLESAVDEVGWTAIDQTTDEFMYAVSRGGGNVYKSTNRGLSFQWSGNGINGGTASWNSPILVATSNPAVLYFGRSIVFRSTDSGANWMRTNGGQPLDGNPLICMAMSHTDVDTVYAGTSPLTSRTHIYRTTNGGSEWSDITGILPDRYPLDLAVDPTNPSVVYVAYGGFGSSHLFKSTDAGMSWTDISGILPDVPATAVVVDPLNPQFVYAGTDIGLFVSTNGGDDWESWDDGFPEAVLISDLTISPSNRTLRASTHGNGVYERYMIDVSVGLDDDGPTLPDQFALEQNYPNPFNPMTEIGFRIAETGFVTLRIYDALGRELAPLVDEKLPAGTYTYTFDGAGLSSGVYYYTLTAGEFRSTRKMLLVR